MINGVQLKNFGPLTELDWQNLGPINLVIGNNGCGKSFLLKAIYSAVRTLENYKRGDEPASLEQILIEKLIWTFELSPRNFRDFLISDSAEFDDRLSFSLNIDSKSFRYEFPHGMAIPEVFSAISNEVPARHQNSIFIPAKEVLGAYSIILKSRQIDKRFGFDDTYYDLVVALQDKTSVLPVEFVFESEGKAVKKIPPLDSSSETGIFCNARLLLEQAIGGVVELSEDDGRWYFKQGSTQFPISVTAEGVRKISIFEILLGNGYLSKDSFVFIDEPESNLHPEAISKLLDIIAMLAKHGIQFFLASHSYTVVKKLFLIAQQQQISIPVLSKEGDIWQQSDLLNDMPDNPIIDESIRLYEEEVDLAFR